MDKRKVVYIDDSLELRMLAGEAFKVGLTKDDTEVEIREDFELLLEEISTGNLADVYILDNEIAGADDEGAVMAQKIHDRAKELGKNVLVITLLCSNPEGVYKEYGEGLKSRSIPVLHKRFQAAICGFYVGKVLRDGQSLLFEEWLKTEGITLPDTSSGRNDQTVRDVSDNILLAIFDSNPPRGIFPEAGAFFEPPRDFITRCEQKITQFMKPNAKELLRETFNLQLSGQERPRQV